MTKFKTALSQTTNDALATLSAPAKINLYLHLFGKRTDGYHALETFILPIDLQDEITLEESEKLSFHFEGEDFQAPDLQKDNLILKAIKLFDETFKTQSHFKITLKKNTPIAAGLGGGSADAAAILRYLTDKHQIDFQAPSFLQKASQLGADIPACLQARPTIARGLGEIIETLKEPLPNFTILLINPNISVPTPAIFKALNMSEIADQSPSLNLPSFDFQNDFERFIAFLKSQENHLEAPAISLFPIIKDVLDALTIQTNCALARLSGSGATCYGLFRRREDAMNAQNKFATEHPEWWTYVTQPL
jgi:4-diphosphocytidyl-2-C-methyl-D-erythritol kinase